MSKTHSPPNKELIALLLMAGLLVLFLINVIVLIPKLVVIYKPAGVIDNKGSIDTQVVGQAMNIIEGE